MESSLFKTARDKARMSVDDVARATRLSPRLVAAIDASRYDQLPAGIYARTAVRAYAAAVGLDATAALAEVRPLLPDARLDMLEVAELRAARDDRDPGIRYFLAAAVDAAVVLLIAGAITMVCGAVCQLMPARLLAIAPGPMGVVCTTPVVLYFWLLGATDVRTVGPRLFGVEILPPSEGPLSLGHWARRGLAYLLREIRFALMAE